MIENIELSTKILERRVKSQVLKHSEFFESVTHNISELIKIYQQIKEQYGEDVNVVFTPNVDTYYNNLSLVITIEKDRIETDEEYKTRIDIELKKKKTRTLKANLRKQKSFENEKALYQKLKVKYG